MNEPGINSFEEFLLMYLFAGFVIGLFWTVLEANVTLGPSSGISDRRVQRLKFTRLLAPFGIVHVAFALVALDAMRAREGDEPDWVAHSRRGRAALEAKAFLVLGLAAIVAIAKVEPWL